MRYVMKAARLHLDPPDPDWASKLAHRLLGADGDLDRRVLGALVAQPKRFKELKPLLGSRTEANLTHALRRLTRDGLIVQWAASWESPSTKVHQMTQMGAAVLYRMVQMRAFDAAANAQDDAAAASA